MWMTVVELETLLLLQVNSITNKTRQTFKTIGGFYKLFRPVLKKLIIKEKIYWIYITFICYNLIIFLFTKVAAFITISLNYNHQNWSKKQHKVVFSPMLCL